MAQITEINITNEEQSLLNNAAIFYRKQALVTKMEQLLQQTAQQLTASLHSRDAFVQSLLHRPHHKITRGENLRALPWQVLDLPRIGNLENLFVTRTLCWWGKYFSFNLVSSGTVWQKLRPVLLQNMHTGNTGNIHIGTGPDIWEQDLETDGFKPLSLCKPDEVPQHYLRVCQQFELDSWPQLPQKAVEVYGQMLQLLEQR